MKVFCHVLRPPMACGVMGLYAAAALVVGAASIAGAAGIVGTGTAESCTDAALDTALAGGGLVKFDCGGPATIDISKGTGTKIIAADTTIDGGDLVTISGGQSVGVFVVNSGVNFTVNNLTVANGNGLVGGIYNDDGMLTATNCNFADNGRFGGTGGGIYNLSGPLTITDSRFTTNFADGGAGGGIYNDTGTMTVTNSIFFGNSAGHGGGIDNYAGMLTVTNSIFTENSASQQQGEGGGGGILNVDGTLTVTGSTFTGNRGGNGGGIDNSHGSLTVTNSTFTGNNTSSFFNGGDGGGIANSGDGSVTSSTFTGNRTDFDNGGGIANGGMLTVSNCTFADNSAAAGLGAGGYGGGIENCGTLIVTNCTIIGNRAAVGGGGIENDCRNTIDGATALLRNTIVADSPSGGNCFGSITDRGHNLDDGTSCGFSTATGSLSNTDPQLDPVGLQDNGGPTQTVALCTAVGEPAGCTAGSPAIEAGDPDICAMEPVNNLDQRAYVRPGTGHTNCSIGAYEADATPVCIGDCNGDGVVSVDELVTGVTIALGTWTLDQCQALDCHGNDDLRVDCLVMAVNDALNGCGSE